MTTSYVYFIVPATLEEARKNPIVKIGKANDVASRLSQLRTSAPFDLTCIDYITLSNDDAAFNLENELHRRLRDYRIRGEWYQVDVGMLGVIYDYPLITKQFLSYITMLCASPVYGIVDLAKPALPEIELDPEHEDDMFNRVKSLAEFIYSWKADKVFSTMDLIKYCTTNKHYILPGMIQALGKTPSPRAIASILYKINTTNDTGYKLYTKRVEAGRLYWIEIVEEDRYEREKN